MHRVEMAVVISAEAGEEEKFKAQGLDIKPHRTRLDQLDEHGHDIETNFKDPEHPLQLVFVCAMWLTGFDAPTLSTLYLDKPMKDHTLMQSIARANRVTPFQINGVVKRNGEIVDYYNVFRNMKKALNAYARVKKSRKTLRCGTKSNCSGYWTMPLNRAWPSVAHGILMWPLSWQTRVFLRTSACSTLMPTFC